MSQILLLPLLGLCEHCNALLNLEGMSVLTDGCGHHLSEVQQNDNAPLLRYEKVGNDWMKVRWPAKSANGFGWVSIKT
jgi:hypothetical protein